MLTGKKPNLSKMRTFGSPCYASKQDKKKLDSRCEKGIFVGNDKNSPAYLVFYPNTDKIVKNKLVKFSTKSVIESHTQTEQVTDDENFNFRRAVNYLPKVEKVNVIPKDSQESKTECDMGNVQILQLSDACDEGQSSRSNLCPQTERRHPQ